MPSRFFDYDADLFRSSRKKDNKLKTGLRQPRIPLQANQVRRISTTEATSATSTRSSHSSTSTSDKTMPGWRPGQLPSRSTGFLNNGGLKHKEVEFPRQVEPTAQIQEWAHQMHIQQRREYWWCAACHPKPPALEIPTDKAMKRVRIQEPTHAYE